MCVCERVLRRGDVVFLMLLFVCVREREIERWKREVDMYAYTQGYITTGVIHLSGFCG